MFCTAGSLSGKANRHALIKMTSDGGESEGSSTNPNVSFTSREDSAHRTKRQQVMKIKATVQADRTARRQFVITQYSTHVHERLELGGDRFSQKVFLQFQKTLGPTETVSSRCSVF